jgi:glutamate mutase epsilon subunit
VYIIIHNRDDKLPTDPKLRKAALDAWEQAESLPLKDAAKLRRQFIKRKRIEEYAERSDLAQASIARARAVRQSMERRINK